MFRYLVHWNEPDDTGPLTATCTRDAKPLVVLSWTRASQTTAPPAKRARSDGIEAAVPSAPALEDVDDDVKRMLDSLIDDEEAASWVQALNEALQRCGDEVPLSVSLSVLRRHLSATEHAHVI